MKKFNGKNAWWLIIIVIIYNLLPLMIFIGKPENFIGIWWIIIAVGYYAFNLIWLPLMIINRIELYDDYFIFYYGFSKEKIFLRDLIKMEKTRNPIASLANSLDRINLVTKKKDFFVALKDNDDFIDCVKQRRSQIIE